MQSHNMDKKLLQSDSLISFENKDDYYSFTPQKSFDNVLIFYPGALVESKAYIPICRKISET